MVLSPMFFGSRFYLGGDVAYPEIAAVVDEEPPQPSGLIAGYTESEWAALSPAQRDAALARLPAAERERALTTLGGSLITLGQTAIQSENDRAYRQAVLNTARDLEQQRVAADLERARIAAAAGVPLTQLQPQTTTTGGTTTTTTTTGGLTSTEKLIGAAILAGLLLFAVKK